MSKRPSDGISEEIGTTWTRDGVRPRNVTPVWDTAYPVSTQVVRLDGVEWVVSTLWADDVGSRLEPISVTVTTTRPVEAPVLADVLRRLPLGTLQSRARRHKDARVLVARDEPDHGARLLEGVAKAGGHRGVATSPDELEVVAEVYKRAWGLGKPVTEAVATHFGISTSTAAKRIMLARKAHLLDDVRRITR